MAASALASVQGTYSAFGRLFSHNSPTYPPPFSPVVSLSSHPMHLRRTSCRRWLNPKSKSKRLIRAMVETTVQGPSAAYAREMERLSAKESLLLALKDAGGFKAFVAGKTTEMQRIDVTERITVLERLNPAPRPTTSPFLEGRWNVEWFGPDTPGLFALQFIFGRLPSTLANLSKMEAWIKDGNCKLMANMRLMNSIETRVAISCKLSVEGPLRMKEEYVEGLLEPPTVIEGAVPDQLKGVLAQVSSAAQQLPAPMRDVTSNGLTVPLGGTFERLLMVSYLDEEILMIRGSSGLPTVFTRLDPAISPAETEYES